MWWTEERLRYYVRAAEKTDFHEKLADAIERNLEGCSSVTELGAGLGYVTEHLSKRGINIKGYDSDPRPVKMANERSGIRLLEVRDVLADPPPKSDAVLMIFFGRMTETDSLDCFLSLAQKKVISVINHHNGHGIKKRENRRTETERLLRERGLRFTAEDITLPFDQPLKDKEDAEDFASAFYDRDAFIETECSGYEDYPLVFRNNKNMTIFTITKEDGL